MKKANDEFEESVDRWFKFVEEYNKESTVPLSYVMLPNTNQSYRTYGSPSGCLKLNKHELRKIGVIQRYK